MSEKPNTATKSMRSPLAKVRGLGSAKSGTAHWLAQRITAVILILLTVFLVCGFVTDVAQGNYASAMIWVHAPLTGAFIALFLLAGFYHAALGLQVVIEDYVHSHTKKLFTLFGVRFCLGILLIMGIIALVRIQVTELVSHG